MKIYLSCDIEGTNGICAWDETDAPNAVYGVFAAKMTREVAAACEGINGAVWALKGGAAAGGAGAGCAVAGGAVAGGAASGSGAGETCVDGTGCADAEPDCEIVIKDAHDSGRNIDHAKLPKNTKLIRGWDESPLSMMQGIGDGFDAAMFTGYHSGGGYNGTPLAHTMNLSSIYKVKINGVLGSEFLINYYTALYYKVPVVMVTGDVALCETVKAVDPQILTVPVNDGSGDSVCAEHPEKTLARIRETAAAALAQRGKVSMTLPEVFDVQVLYHSHIKATRASWYPGAYRVDASTIGFRTNDFFEFLKYLLFT